MATAREAQPVLLASTGYFPSNVDKDKNPILFIHTVGHSRELWPQEEIRQIAVRTKRTSFVIDARCHGDSEHNAPFSPDLMVTDLLSYMDLNNFAKAVLVGHGLGGVAVCLFALRHPERVELLVNIEGALNEEILQDTNRASLRYLNVWATSVRNAPVKLSVEAVVRRAYDEVNAEFQEEGLEVKELFYRFSHPIRRLDQGYDVKHNVRAISEYLNRSATGEEVLNLDGTFDGPALFMMANRSQAREGLERRINGKFLRANVTYLVATHHIHLLFPRLFLETFMAFHNDPHNV